VGHLKITILSTMLAQEGIGDWGFGALIECDNSQILFDTGGREFVVRDNARELHIDLSKVPVVVLSHGHPDHTAGWLSLRQELLNINTNALALTYVAPGFFNPVIFGSGGKFDKRPDSAAYEAGGGKIEVISTWKEILPGVFLTGKDVPRIYPEKNYPAMLKRQQVTGQIVRDTIPEDMSMVISTAQGLVLLTGCGHTGTVNLVTAVEKYFPGQKIYAAIGGFHLLAASDQQIEWTAKALKKAGVRYFLGAHCTGIQPVQQIMDIAGLKRNECIVGSVGATFVPTIGFIAGQLTMGPDKNAYFKQ
jgi:7,8-dihydropterin-6-yl-methyl-4-(beta-D-ribofuranosyl)aminobenzene 5'-phosphate synthase